MGKEPLLLRRTFTDAHRGRAGHINIQHYAQLIGEATEILLERSGLSVQLPVFATDEKVRFLAELHPGDVVEAYAGITTHDRHGIRVAGELRRTRDKSTVCLFNRELVPWVTQSENPGSWDNAPVASSDATDHDISEIEMAFRGSTLNDFREPDTVREVDAHNIMTPRALWHVITEALWATQTKLGADQATLKRRGITGGATVFQLQHQKPITLGSHLSVTTAIVGLSDSSLRMQHEVRNAADENELFLCSRYVLTFFDRIQGQRCPLSEVFPGKTLTS
jgi:acyl-CoA thioesterase FadM